MRVLQVRNPAHIYQRFVEHTERIAQRDTQGSAHVQRRFHGTSLAPGCAFGIDVTQPPCTNPQCAVCTICATSFDLSLAGSTGRAGGFFRYGRGLYFSRVSSKSNDYNERSERHNPHSLRAGRYRLMFLCKVAEGNAHRTTQDTLSEAQVHTPSWTAAWSDPLRYPSLALSLLHATSHLHSPFCTQVNGLVAAGADSVVGLSIADGGAINHEETVVYCNEAAIPSYLIVYQI